MSFINKNFQATPSPVMAFGGFSHFFVNFILLLTLSTLSNRLNYLVIVEAKCPTSNDHSEQQWCLQVDGFDTIVLDGNKFVDLNRVFDKISFLFEDSGEKKELDQLMLLNNHAIEKLERNAFGEFRFRKIQIKNCTRLAKFDNDSFNGTKKLLKSLVLHNIGVTAMNQEDFFESLNTLEALEDLELRGHKIRTIPPYSFRQQHLTKLYLEGPFEELKSNAFFYLDSIRILYLKNSIHLIEQQAFNLKPSNKTVDIYLDGKLGKIERGVFTHTLRPLTINIFLNRYTNFDQAIFRPILMAPLAHDIILHGKPKDMTNPCQLLWLLKGKFRGGFNFRNEPQINESYFDSWQCNNNDDNHNNNNNNNINDGGGGARGIGEDDQEIDINQAGTHDATHNSAGDGVGKKGFVNSRQYLSPITNSLLTVIIMAITIKQYSLLQYC